MVVLHPASVADVPAHSCDSCIPLVKIQVSKYLVWEQLRGWLAEVPAGFSDISSTVVKITLNQGPFSKKTHTLVNTYIPTRYRVCIGIGAFRQTLDHHPIPVSFIAKVCHPIPARRPVFLVTSLISTSEWPKHQRWQSWQSSPSEQKPWKSLKSAGNSHGEFWKKRKSHGFTGLENPPLPLASIFHRSSGGAQPPGFQRQTCFHWKPPLWVLGPWSLGTPQKLKKMLKNDKICVFFCWI